MKVVVITPIPTPYRDPFWQVVSEQSNVQLTVVYCSDGRSDRPWSENSDYRFTRCFPRSMNLMRWGGWGSSCYWNSEISQLLSERQPDVVLVGGYNHFTMLKTVSWCRQTKTPWLLMSESWRKRGGILGALKERWLRRWLSTAAGALPTGSLASQYLESLGIPCMKQCLVPNVPDISHLQQTSREIRANPLMTRNELGLPAEGRIVLFAARMIDKKRPFTVIEAFRKLSDHQNLILVMLGDGPLRSEAIEMARQSEFPATIRFPGFVKSDVVHQWMSVADVFVQPSSETWGVAPIEALACGCSLVLSREIGCHADLIGAANHAVSLQNVEPISLSRAISDQLKSISTDRSPGVSTQHWLQHNSHNAIAARLTNFLNSLPNIKGGHYGE